MRNAMKNKTRFQNSTLVALSCLTLTTLACTKSDSLGEVGSCQYPLDSHVNAAGNTVWTWRFHWQNPSAWSSCAAWGADAKMVLEVDVPANPSGSGTSLPTCSSDVLSTGAGPACAMANAWRFETACTDGQILVELPSLNVFHGYYHMESSTYPNSPRNLVSQDVHCNRDLYVGAGFGSPPSTGNDGGVDAAPDSSSCGAGSPVHYSAPGCGADAVPICGSFSQDACLQVIPYCGCDGRTTIQGACGTSPSPYLYAGECKQDGGVDAPPDSAGCASGYHPYYTAAGCGTNAVPVCLSGADTALAIAQFCACDGVTTVTDDARGTISPYLYAGACKQDGGSNPDGYRSPFDTMPDGADCGGGRYIHYTAPGCGAQAVPLCEAPTQDACAAIRWYCSCDGVTGVIGGCGTSNVPYLYEGACKQDGGVDAVPPKTDGGDPCAACTAGQVCVQSFDGTCHTTGPGCITVTDTCRTKLSASGAKSCTSLPECQSDFCSSPYQCRISPPCGTEAPQAAIYCYGP